MTDAEGVGTTSAVKDVPLDELLIDPDLQLRRNRAELNEAVERYRDVLASGKSLPPIEVFEVTESDGERDAGVYIVEGHLRYEAHELEKKKRIQCMLVGSGTFLEARLVACGANARHGLPRTPAETEAAVKVAWKTMELMGKKPSTRKVGELCHVSNATVSRIMNPPAPETRPLPPAPVEQGGGDQGESRRDLGGPKLNGAEAVGDFVEQGATDAHGTTLPESNVTICREFEGGRHLRMAVNLISQAMDELLQGRNLLCSENHKDRLTQVADDELSRAVDAIRRLTPDKLCDHCEGEGCDHCGGRGYHFK